MPAPYRRALSARPIVTAPVLPAWTVAPSITLPGVGQSSLANAGSYTGTAPITVGYQWQTSVDDVAWSNITGATSTTSPVWQAGDAGTYKRCVVTLTNAAGSASQATTSVQISAPPGADLTAALSATVISGTAPLGVMFDATATTSTLVSDTFRQVTYTFDYDDANATGNWLHSGRPKNSDVGGPLAAHVFEVPGTYVVEVTAQVGATTSTATVTITVADPDVTYAGSATICISTDASTGWGPAGATYQTTLPTGTGWTGKRVLFKRGQDFSSLGTSGAISIDPRNENFMIGAAGSGAKPILPAIQSYSRPSTTRGDGSAINCDGMTVTDVQISGTRCSNSTDWTFHKVDFKTPISDNYKQCVNFSGDYYALADPSRNFAVTAYRMPARRILSECTFESNYTAAGPVVQVYAEGRFMAFIGCDWKGGAVEHCLRTPWMWKGVVAHNRIQGGYKTPGRHNITARTAGLLPTGAEDRYTTEMQAIGGTNAAQRFVILAWNDLSGPNDYPRDGGVPAVTFEISSQNHTNAEGSEDIIIEGNVLRPRPSGYDGSGAEEIWMCGRRVTYIGNTRTADAQPVDVVLNWKSGGVPAEWQGPYFTSRA